jgi:dienelactone hydrolase
MRTLFVLACFSSLMAAIGSADGAEPARRLLAPWPNGSAIAAIEGQDVTFPSASPFSPADFADPTDAPETAARATLFMPPGRHRPRSVPAVIMLHGSGGVLYAREMTYGRQLAAMGVAALVVDAFAARRDLGVGFVERLLNITESMLIADAYAGLRWLAASHPEIDPARVALVGFSYGAMASMYAMHARVASQLGGGLKFAGHVAFYGPCIARFSDKATTGAPLLYLYGTADKLIDRARCEQFAADLREGGSEAEIVAYEGAPHQWDGGWGRRTIGRTMHRCRLWVERDGTVRDLNTLLPMSTPFARKLILGFCANGPPYAIGADEAVRARSNRDLGRFLARIFAQ